MTFGTKRSSKPKADTDSLAYIILSFLTAPGNHETLIDLQGPKLIWPADIRLEHLRTQYGSRPRIRHDYHFCPAQLPQIPVSQLDNESPFSSVAERCESSRWFHPSGCNQSFGERDSHPNYFRRGRLAASGDHLCE